MKDLKEFILEKRIIKLKVDGKKVPDKYIAVFNDYLVEIAELIKTHDRELVKEVCEKIKTVFEERQNTVGYNSSYGIDRFWFDNFIDQIQKEIEDENNED